MRLILGRFCLTEGDVSDPPEVGPLVARSTVGNSLISGVSLKTTRRVGFVVWPRFMAEPRDAVRAGGALGRLGDATREGGTLGRLARARGLGPADLAVARSGDIVRSRVKALNITSSLPDRLPSSSCATPLREWS